MKSVLLSEELDLNKVQFRQEKKNIREREMF